MEPINYLWKDRKRHLGLPLSFTRYRLSEDRVFCETGFLNIHEEEVLLYRVRDLDLKNVKHPREVKELIYRNVEDAKDRRGLRSTELMGDRPEDGDFLHDEPESGHEFLD